MATMSLLTYTLPNMKLQSSNNSDNDAKLTNISNNSDLMIVRKKLKTNQMTSIPSATVFTSHSDENTPVLGQIMMNNQQSKKRRVSDGSTGSGKMKSVPAVSVARRNARERNRVKQVNNGFSMLRDHIPPEIADTFEVAGRGSAKKLSKVETLRMAVEYIRSLEKMLSFESNNDSLPSPNYNNSTFSNMSTMSNMSDTSLPATPPPEQQQPLFYAIKPRPMSNGSMMETQITIVNGQQYIRIPGTNTFQLITNDSFENEENIHPHDDEYTTTFQHQISNQFASEHSASPSPPPLLQQQQQHHHHQNIQPLSHNLLNSSTLNFVNNIQHSNLINSTTSSDPILTTTTTATPLRIITPAGSISPSSFSGHSNSPAPSHTTDNINSNNIIMDEAQFQILTATGREPTDDDKEFKPTTLQFPEQILMSCPDDSHYDNLMLKQEIIDDEAIFDETSLSNENMIDALSWWHEQQQNLNQNIAP